MQSSLFPFSAQGRLTPTLTSRFALCSAIGITLSTHSEIVGEFELFVPVCLF